MGYVKIKKVKKRKRKRQKVKKRKLSEKCFWCEICAKWHRNRTFLIIFSPFVHFLIQKTVLKKIGVAGNMEVHMDFEEGEGEDCLEGRPDVVQTHFSHQNHQN